MGSIRIENPGLLTTVQDAGRRGYQQFGIPVSGVMDHFAQRIANILVGNGENEGILEINIMGPQIEFLEDAVIAITGASLSTMVNRIPVNNWESIFVQKGSKLSFGVMQEGCRAYISFAGGVSVPVVMESKSTYLKAKIGGYKGRGLKKDDILTIGEPLTAINTGFNRKLPPQYIPSYNNNIEVNVVLGPQDDYFTEEAINTFFSKSYTVTNECDRMGYRLDGPQLAHKSGADIVSDGIVMGSIQVPGQGLPIILMADRQTAGGYTKIATVISTDLYKIAQSKQGDVIRFKQISIAQAQDIYLEREALIERINEECVQNLEQKYEDTQRTMKPAKYYHVVVNQKSFDVKVEEVL